MPQGGLKARVVSGLRWTALAKGLGQVVTWSSTLILVRLLTPADYGIVTMATVVSSYLLVLSEMGLSAALIQRRDLDVETRRSVLGLLIGIGVVLFVVSALLAPLVAEYFQEVVLAPVMIVVALQFLLLPFSIIPHANLAIAMRFRALGNAILTGASIGAVVTVLLAYLGFGPYALAIGVVVALFARVVIINVLAPFPHAPQFRLDKMRTFVSFSRYVLVERTIWYWYAELDSVIIGRAFGAASVGVYAIAKQISIMLSERFVEVMNTVAMPAYSSVQDDLARVRTMYVKTLRLTAMVSFPVFWGIALVAPELVALVLGRRWLEAIPLVQLLCISMPFRTLGSLAPPMLLAIGRPDVTLRCTIGNAIIVVCALLAGTSWGVAGVAAGWAVAAPLTFSVNSFHVGRALGLRPLEILLPLFKPLLCAAIMAGVTWHARHWLADMGSNVVMLLALVATGAVMYPATAWILARTESRELLRMGGDLVKR